MGFSILRPIKYHWYQLHSPVPHAFLALWQGLSICQFFSFLLFFLSCPLVRQNTYNGKFPFFFLLFNTEFRVLAGIRLIVRISKSQVILCISYSSTDSSLFVCNLGVWSNYYYYYYYSTNFSSFFFFKYFFIFEFNFFVALFFFFFFFLLLLLLLLLLLFIPQEFFTSAFADGLSPKFEWQQVSSSLQDTSQFYGRSQ